MHKGHGTSDLIVPKRKSLGLRSIGNGGIPGTFGGEKRREWRVGEWDWDWDGAGAGAYIDEF